MMMKKLLQLIRFLFIKQDVMEVYYIQGMMYFPSRWTRKRSWLH